MKHIKKVMCVLLTLCLLFGMVSSVSVAEINDGKVKSELSFTTMSDPHYFPKSLTGDNCQAWLDYCSRNAKLYRYCDEIVRTTLDTMLIRNPDLKYILVPGDLTKDSEYEAHVELAKIFGEYEEEYGVEFIVTAGNHDINSPRASTFENGVEEQGRSITATEFREVYADYGYDLAFEEYAAIGDNVQGQLSYAVDLDGGALVQGHAAVFSRGSAALVIMSGRHAKITVDGQICALGQGQGPVGGGRGGRGGARGGMRGGTRVSVEPPK